MKIKIHDTTYIFLLVFIFKNKLNINYGLCSSPYKSKHFLFFIPLFVLISVNLWFGVQITTNFINQIIYNNKYDT